MNRVVNARDAMPAGGEVTIETAAVKLDSGYASTQSGDKPGTYVTPAVTDIVTQNPQCYHSMRDEGTLLNIDAT